MLFFGVRKDTFNGLFPLLIKMLVLRCIACIVRQILIVLPDMPLYCLYTVFGAGTKFSGRTACAEFRIAFVFPVLYHILLIIALCGVALIARDGVDKKKSPS